MLALCYVTIATSDFIQDSDQFKNVTHECTTFVGYNCIHYIQCDAIVLGRCLQHRGGEPEQAKGADGIQLFALDCIAYIVDAEMDCVCL